MIRHKTYRGAEFNMAALVEKNGDARAVSNISMNARGDIVDKQGKVRVSAKKIAETASNVNSKKSNRVSLKADSDTAPVKNKSVTPDNDFDNDKVVAVREIVTLDGPALEYEFSDGSIQVVAKNLPKSL